MRYFLKETPFALSGVMLGCTSLGNLLGIQAYMGFLVAAFLGLLLAKLVLFFPSFKQELQNPVSTSIMGTFNLTLMLFSIYLPESWWNFRLGLWSLGIILHIVLMFYFSWKFMPKQKIADLHGSYFIVYIGLVVASLTAPAYQAYTLGEVFWWLSLPLYLGLIGPVAYRYWRYSAMPEVQRPLVCILTAPPNLCLAAYLQLKTGEGVDPLAGLVAALAVVSLLSYLIILSRVVFLIKPKVFYPSYAALTFPFVISAMASNSLVQYLGTTAAWGKTLQIWFYFQAGVAVLLVSFTLLRYLQALLHFLLVERKIPPAH